MKPERIDPIRELTIRDEHSGSARSELKVCIDEAGELVLEGWDVGPATGFVGVERGDDHEYLPKVPATWRDTVLLRLVAERFKDTSELRAWCTSHGIPSKFETWP